MKFIDWFSALSGFHLAALELDAECVFASELDEGLRSLYKKNFGIEPAGDIRVIPADDIRTPDLLYAGFPCQSFSQAGSQKGWNDKICGTIFESVVKILESHQPEFLILENVARLVLEKFLKLPSSIFSMSISEKIYPLSTLDHRSHFPFYQD